jgi:hypothetical protein
MGTSKTYTCGRAFQNTDMTRKEFVGRLVLMEIADDYENLERIRSMVTRDSSRCGLAISESEIVRGLADLIDAGLATALRLSGNAPAQAIQGVPTPREIEEFYTHFLATSKGAELLASDREWWPFDDVGDLRSDWVRPEG